MASMAPCIPALVLATLAAVLAWHGASGWGWFLFMAFLLFVSTDNDTDPDDKPA